MNDPTLTLNGKKFVKGAKAMPETLFAPGGTADGFYKVLKHDVRFYAPDGEHVASVNKYGVLWNAFKRPDGKTWYNLGHPKLIGAHESYMTRVEECHAVLAAVGIERAY